MVEKMKDRIIFYGVVFLLLFLIGLFGVKVGFLESIGLGFVGVIFCLFMSALEYSFRDYL